MSLQYIENNIEFNNIIPITRSDTNVPTYKKYIMEDGITEADIDLNGYIQEPEQTYINSIDIHWGNALLSSYIGRSAYIGHTDIEHITKTSDLLNYTQNKVNENDFVKLLNYFTEVDDTLTKTLTQNSLILGLKNQRKVLFAYNDLDSNYNFENYPELFFDQYQTLLINYNAFINNYTRASNHPYIIPNYTSNRNRLGLFIQKDLNNENNNQIPYINDGNGEIIFIYEKDIEINNIFYKFYKTAGYIGNTQLYIN